METNDYIQIAGSLYRIINMDGTVREISTGIEFKDNLTSCHIPITREVLIACGFQKGENGQYYTDLQEGDTICGITCTFIPLDEKYSMILTDKKGVTPFDEEIGVLSELQDWVREKSGLELNVDESKLAKALSLI